jgi:hypothetical protein
MPIRFSFSLLIGLSAVLGHFYLYRRLVWSTVRSRGPRLAVLAVLVLMTLALMNRREVQRLVPAQYENTVAVVMYVWMGVALCLLIALLAVDLARGALSLLGRALSRRVARSPPARAEPAVDEERRRFLARAMAGTTILAGGGMAAYGSWRAFAPPAVIELAVRIPKLPRTLEGLSIVQLTDIHVGPFIRREFMDELVHRANALRPDLVAITGDLVDGDVPTLGESVAALGNLKARFGSFFVTGNHEYFSGDEAWVEFLERLGVQVLRNRRVSVGDAGGSLDLVGVDDWSGGRRRGKRGYDLEQALAGRAPDRAAVLLAHQPAGGQPTGARQAGADDRMTRAPKSGVAGCSAGTRGSRGWHPAHTKPRYGTAAGQMSRSCSGLMWPSALPVSDKE